MKKKATFGFLMIVMVLAIQFLNGCGKDDGTNPEDQRIKQLTGAWQLDEVVNDNLDVTNRYTGFTLTVDEMNFTTQNGNNAWPSIGTYDFANGNIDLLIRSDGVDVTIDEITNTSLTISFQMADLAGGRQAGITGDFTFSLSK